jgi:hypothetical protein
MAVFSGQQSGQNAHGFEIAVAAVQQEKAGLPAVRRPRGVPRLGRLGHDCADVPFEPQRLDPEDILALADRDIGKAPDEGVGGENLLPT